jgi:hypothetical protein
MGLSSQAKFRDNFPSRPAGHLAQIIVGNAKFKFKLNLLSKFFTSVANFLPRGDTHRTELFDGRYKKTRENTRTFVRESTPLMLES